MGTVNGRSASGDGVSCRICGGTEFIPVHQVPHLRLPLLVQYVACTRCSTVYDAGSYQPDYRGNHNADYEEADIKFYVEYGANLQHLARLLACLNRVHLYNHREYRPRFLDVGTAFGFAVALAESCQWDAVGVEPSDMGKLGRQLLGVEVIQGDLGSAHLPKESFDYILLSDVIEHVIDPRELIASLVEHLKPDGVLLLTTPNSKVLLDSDEREVVDVLSPGYHMCILSPDALRRLLCESGFEEIRLSFEGGTSGRKMVTALASRRWDVLPPDISWSELGAEASSVVGAYLERLVARKERLGETDMLYGGALFRLFVQRRYGGDCPGAERYAQKIARLYAQDGMTAERMRQLKASSFRAYVEQVPAYSGMFCFQRGMLELEHQRDYEAAASDFGIAEHLFGIEQSTRIYPRSGWTERAQYRRGLAALRAGRVREALAAFDRLIAASDDVPVETWKGIHRHKGWAHLRRLELGRALVWLARSVCQPPVHRGARVLCRLGAALLRHPKGSAP